MLSAPGTRPLRPTSVLGAGTLSTSGTAFYFPTPPRWIRTVIVVGGLLAGVKEDQRG